MKAYSKNRWHSMDPAERELLKAKMREYTKKWLEDPENKKKSLAYSKEYYQKKKQQQPADKQVIA